MKVKVRKGTFQHVESELAAYHETRKEIVRLQNDILHRTTAAADPIGASRGGLPADPTGNKAVMLTSHT